MKKLMLVRHAKASHNIANLTDFERPLNAQGLETAPQMAMRLANKGIVPQYVVSSPAKRAKDTALIFAETFDVPPPQYNADIYEASYTTLLTVVNNLPDEHAFIALFGHNPGLSELMYYLTGKVYDMPTCAAVVIHFDFVSWQMVSGGTGTIEFYDYPKNT